MPTMTGADAHARATGARTLLVALACALTACALAACARDSAEEQARERGATKEPPAATLRVSGDEVAITLDSAALARTGIRTEVLRPQGALGTTAPALGAGAGTSAVTGELVADPGLVTTIRAAVPGRLSAVGGRWPMIGERIDAGTVVAQVSDARPLSTPRGGTVTRVSAQPGEIVQPGQELLQLADFGELLARIVWRADAPPAPPTLRIVPLASAAGMTTGAATGTTAGWLAHLVGPAAEVDSITRSPVYLYRLRAAPGLRPGLPVMAVPTEGRERVRATGAAGTGGLVVPSEAVVQWEGLAWVYVQRAAGRFVRVRVETTRPVNGGWLIAAASTPTPAALAAGDAIVVRGAQQLLSAEFQSRIPQDEEAAK
jgi:biotin carboxyl carrier protein